MEAFSKKGQKFEIFLNQKVIKVPERKSNGLTVKQKHACASQLNSKLRHVRVTNDDSVFFKDARPIETRDRDASASTRKRINSLRFQERGACCVNENPWLS